MKIQYFRGDQPNFGDELNEWLWPQLRPGFFDDDASVLFIGVGSIIGTHYDAAAQKLVFGTGYVPTYHEHAPNVHGGDWDIFFVRGPRTARALGLPKNLGIGDGAILLRALDTPFRRDPRYIGFIPHWQSMARGNWQAACKLAGIRLIDPRAPVEQVIAEILGCEVLIAEAMHGAIVADALRVPWIPVLPIDGAHREKWFDWADALELRFRHHRLWPSSPEELYLATSWRPFLSRLANGLARRPLSSISRPPITHIAAHRLRVLSRYEPSLSTDSIIARATEQMVDKLNQLEKKYRKEGHSADTIGGNPVLSA